MVISIGLLAAADPGQAHSRATSRPDPVLYRAAMIPLRACVLAGEARIEWVRALIRAVLADPGSPDEVVDARMGLSVAVATFRFLDDAVDAAVRCIAIVTAVGADGDSEIRVRRAFEDACYNQGMAMNNLGLLGDNPEDDS
jgi:hypothetical protein